MALTNEEQGANTPLAWSTSALVLTSVVAVVAKGFGVVVAPGLRGVASQKTVETVDNVAATLAYLLAALLVALVCGASFELARTRKVPIVIRGSIVALAGLVVALASPAVISQLHPAAALALSVVTSLVALAAGVATARAPHTRALGAVIALLALAGALRPFAWEVASMSADRSSIPLYNVSTGIAGLAIMLHAFATLLAAIWLATRSLWTGRIAANVAVILSFGVTYLALRESEGPTSSLDAVLRTSFARLVQTNLPFGISAVALFLVPASILLGLVAIAQSRSRARLGERAQPTAVAAAFALTLISAGAFDVPLQALAAVAGAQWALLAMADERGMWSALMTQRLGVKQPTSPDSPSA